MLVVWTWRGDAIGIIYNEEGKQMKRKEHIMRYSAEELCDFSKQLSHF